MDLVGGPAPVAVPAVVHAAIPVAVGRGRRRRHAEESTWVRGVAYTVGFVAMVGWEAIEPLVKPVLDVLGEQLGRVSTVKICCGLAMFGDIFLRTISGQRLVAKISPWAPSRKTMERASKVFEGMNAMQANQVVLNLSALASGDRNLDRRPVISKPTGGMVTISYGNSNPPSLNLDAIVLLKALPILRYKIQNDASLADSPQLYAPIIRWLDDGEFERIDNYKQDNNFVMNALFGVQAYDDLLAEVAGEAQTRLGASV